MNKDLQALVDKLDEVFSIFIRTRDATSSGLGRCCTCGRVKEWKYMDCGHFISRRHYATRWEEKNCALQCKGCNGFGQGEQHLFAQYIDKRWGPGTADMLQLKKHNTFKLNRGTLKILIQHYQVKNKSHDKETTQSSMD